MSSSMLVPWNDTASWDGPHIYWGPGWLSAVLCPCLSTAIARWTRAVTRWASSVDSAQDPSIWRSSNVYVLRDGDVYTVSDEVPVRSDGP